MNNLLYPLCSAVALLALLYKVRVLRSERSITQVALVAHFFSLFVTFTVSSPPVWVAVSDFVGIVNFSGLLTQSSVVVLTACQQLVLLDLTYGPDIAKRKARPRILVLALVLVVMVVLFALSNAQEEAPDDFAVTRAQEAPVYLIAYLAAFTINQVEIGVMGWRYAHIAPSVWLRRGLKTVAFALPFALIYTGVRISDIVAAQLGSTGHSWEAAAQVSVALAVVVQTVGWILPDWGPQLTATKDRLQYRRTYRTLSSLHRALTEHVPEPVIPVNYARDPRTRLYRLAVEIRDAQWILRSWMDPEVARVAREEATKAELADEEFAAVVEAAQLRSAMEAMRQDRPPLSTIESPVVAAPGDLAAELAFQKRLARAMSSPVVLRALDRVAASEATRREST